MKKSVSRDALHRVLSTQLWRRQLSGDATGHRQRLVRENRGMNTWWLSGNPRRRRGLRAEPHVSQSWLDEWERILGAATGDWFGRTRGGVGGGIYRGDLPERAPGPFRLCGALGVPVAWIEAYPHSGTA
jgi:hypothetical protein